MKIVTPIRVIIALFVCAVVAVIIIVWLIVSKPTICYWPVTPLHDAIKYNESLKEVKKLVEGGASIYEEYNHGGNAGETPIELALSKKRYDIAEYLISKGLDLNKPAPERKHTALNGLSSNCDTKAIEWLIEKGANVNLESGNGSPLRNIVRNDICHTPQCESKCLESAKLLISHGANVNEGASFTPLKEAAMNCDMKMAELLLKNGATINKNEVNDFVAANKVCDKLATLLKGL